MAYHNKRYYAQRVITGLQNSYPNQDFKIREQEVFPVIDDIVNKFAEQNYFDNWKLAGTAIDEGFITTWDEVEVIDQDNDLPSYMEFPSNYAALPRNRGIEEIWPLNYQLNGQDHSVVIMSHSDVRRYANLYAGNVEGRLSGYPKGTRFFFTKCDVKKRYGNMGVRLVVRSSADISLTAPYPIPSNFEAQVIELAIKYFSDKRNSPTDTVRDGKDQA
jgi:hypothetical protein